jgi:hypothetical protein
MGSIPGDQGAKKEHFIVAVFFKSSCSEFQLPESLWVMYSPLYSHNMMGWISKVESQVPNNPQAMHRNWSVREFAGPQQSSFRELIPLINGS